MKVRLSLHDAIAAHRLAVMATYTAQPGRPLQRATLASDNALDVLLGTPAGDVQGARDLLGYLRWWLKESGDEVGTYAENHYVAQARAADLAMLLFAPDPSAGLKAFAREMIEAAGCGDDVDGATIQGRAVAHGLLTEAPYDPAVHGPITTPAAGPDDTWFTYAGPLARGRREGGAA